ncbi:unnamed protein product [Mytilus coruscus]|nr:unnamed protein product [Mytilus coruscus]
MQQSNKVIHHTSNNDVKHSGNIPNYTQQKESNSKISYPLISGKKTADTGYSESIISKSTNMANTQVKSYNKINSLDHSNNVNGQLQNNNDYGDNSRYIQHGRDNDVSFARRTQSNQSSDITERIQHQTMRRRRTENGMESKQMQQSKRNDGVAKYAQQAIQSNDQGYNVAGSSIAQQAIQSNDQGYNVAGSGIAQQDQRYNVAGNGIAQQAIQSNDQGYNVAGSGIAQQDQGYNVAGNGIAQQAIQHNGQVYDAAGSGVRESQLAESRNFNHRSNQNVVKNQMEKSANNQYTKDSNSKTEYIQEKSQSSGHSYGEINKQQLKQTGEKSYHMLKTTQTGDNLYGQIKLPQTTDIDGNGRYIHQTGGSYYDSTKDGLQLSKQSMHTGINNYGRSNDGVQNSKTDGNAGYLHQTSQTGGAKTNYGLTNSEFLQAITGGGDSWYSPRTTQTGDNQYGPENARISKSTETAKHIDTENMKHQSGTNTEKTVDSNFGFSQGSDSYDSKQQRVQIQNSYGRSTFMDNDNINGQTQLQLVENLGQSSQLQENMGQTSQLPVNLGKTSQVQERGGYKEHRVMQASNIHAPLSSKQTGNGYITSKVSQIPSDNVNNNFKQRIQSPIIVLSKGDSSFNQINENSHNGAQMPGAVLKDIVESHEVKRIYGNAIEKVNPTNVNVAKRKNVETTGAYRKTENVYHSGHKYGFNTESTRATEVYGNKIEKLNPTGLYKAKIEKPQSPEVYRMNKDNVKPTVTENIVMKLSSPSTYRRYK